MTVSCSPATRRAPMSMSYEDAVPPSEARSGTRTEPLQSDPEYCRRRCAVSCAVSCAEPTAYDVVGSDLLLRRQYLLKVAEVEGSGLWPLIFTVDGAHTRAGTNNANASMTIWAIVMEEFITGIQSLPDDVYDCQRSRLPTKYMNAGRQGETRQGRRRWWHG